ncbi:MAG: polyphosphate kinase 1, partial [Hymenobacteraceae bacterium]|nr:polyphosphate kinase 1 [Hymenobacteraceae bacterium]
ADPRLTAEVNRVFTFLTTRQHEGHQFEHLLVAPFNLRERLAELIEAEIANARAGKPAYILLKLNALQDEAMIRLLYLAADEGVRVQLNIRGISCLVPGGAGGPKRIVARGIVDRYLEHARVYLFGNGGGPENELVFVGSADWMHRNLSRRVEVAFPIFDPTLRAELRALVDLQQHDNVKARDYHNHLLVGEKKAEHVQAQAVTYEYLRAAAKTP